MADHSGRARDTRPPISVQVQFPPGYRFSRLSSYRVSGEMISQQNLAPAGSPFVLRDFLLRGDAAAIVVLSR